MTDHPDHPRPGWVRPTLSGLTALLTVLILVQAALAGQHLFGDGAIDVHGYLGNASFTIGVIVAAAAVFGRGPRPVLVLAALLLVALFAQIGLGYAGRTSAGAAAWHIPVGVTSLGLAASLLTVVTLGSGAGRDRPAPG